MSCRLSSRVRSNNAKWSKIYSNDERLVRYIYKLVTSKDTRHFSNNRIRYIIGKNHKAWAKKATFKFVQIVRASAYGKSSPKKALIILKKAGYLK